MARKDRQPRSAGWTVQKRDHAGTTAEDIQREPDWSTAKHAPNGRRAGTTGDEYDVKHSAEVKSANHDLERMKEASKQGTLVNFQQALKSDKDFGSSNSEGHWVGWRYMLDSTESGIKDQDWPINASKRENEWRKEGEEKAQNEEDSNEDAKGDQDEQGDEEGESEWNRLTPQQRACLRAIEEESKYIPYLATSDGKGRSNVINHTYTSVDEADQLTPDNWIVRSPELIRLVGKHPLNAEAPLSRIFESGFITPNELHYVRSHAAVPRLVWETHLLEIITYNGKTIKLSMNDLKKNFSSLNLPIFMACDNGRRREMKMVKQTKGFNWGPGAVGCAYWKGPLLRDVLLAAGVPERMPDQDKQRYFVHFRGADEPNEHYETSIPFEYIMDENNDVLLAYEMNDVPLPPDHGYPVRLVIPGYVGGRNVKWLEKIWIDTKENSCYMHIWDNRVVPSFIEDMDSELASHFFHLPDTAAYEQMLNSVITIPAQGDTIDLKDVTKGKEYRIQGYAYNGHGDEVQRVEVSLDEGKTWMYCIRTFPEAPIRHGNKFWTWCFWHIDVQVADLVRSPGITVRCFDVKKMTQPEKPIWNILGSMNNAQYTVRPEMITDGDVPHIIFRHPVEPGNGEGGWMKNSAENEIAEAGQKTDVPSKQFTKEEIEKHNTEQDCWIVVNNCVYDATSVLPWHPGGAAAVMPHAGKVHAETTGEFSSIHDDYAWGQLNECILGTVTDKAAQYIKRTAEQAQESESQTASDQALQKHRWVAAKLLDKKGVSHDTSQYTFQLPKGTEYLGIGTCQHIQFGFHMRDRMLMRPYTPTKPVLDRESKVHPEDKELHDGTGTFQLTVKTYFADDEQPGGAFSNILDALPIGGEVEMKGPDGDIVYQGSGKFSIRGEEKTFKRISLILGGTGLTPGYSLIARICLTPEDKTELRVIDANKGEADILLREELKQYEQNSNGQLKLTHVLSDPSEEWDGLKGYVTGDIMKEHLFGPEEGNVTLLCGPPAMIEKAVIPALEEWGFEQDENMFGL